MDHYIQLPYILRGPIQGFRGGQLNPHGLPFAPLLALLITARLTDLLMPPTPDPTTYLLSIDVYDSRGNRSLLTPDPLPAPLGLKLEIRLW